MKKRMIWCIVLVLIVMFSVSCKSDKYDAEEDFQVRIIGNKKAVRITSYAGINEVVRIPPRIKRLPVTVIGSEAFMGRQISSVTIPEGVTTIEDKAFAKNQLRTVIIPQSVTSIGKSAFANNHLINITIPDSVFHIGGSAFAKNELTAITIGADVRLGDGDVVWDYYWRRWTSITAFGNFDRFYKENGKRAGTYTYSNGRWNRQ